MPRKQYWPRPVRLEKAEEAAARDWSRDRGSLSYKMAPLLGGEPDRLHQSLNCPLLPIELKRTKGGTVDPKQDEWGNRSWQHGQPAFVAYGENDYRDIVETWEECCAKHGVSTALQAAAKEMAERMPGNLLGPRKYRQKHRRLRNASSK